MTIMVLTVADLRVRIVVTMNLPSWMNDVAIVVTIVTPIGSVIAFIWNRSRKRKKRLLDLQKNTTNVYNIFIISHFHEGDDDDEDNGRDDTHDLT